MQDSSLRIDIGKVQAAAGALELTFVVSETGDAHVQLSAAAPSSSDKGGVTVTLDEKGFEQLKAAVMEADEMRGRMVRAGRIKRMALPH